MARIWRQGDVTIREVSEIPNNALHLKSNKIRIASETGNPHVLRATQVFETKDLEPTQRYALLEEDAAMTHPQHASLHLSPGIYLITTVRDYAPARGLMD